MKYQPHPHQAKGGVMPYWLAMHWCLRLSAIAFTAGIVLTCASIPAPWASATEILEIVFASVMGVIGIITGMCGWISQIDGGTRYSTQLAIARQTRGLPQHGSAYKAIATGEYVEIWEGNRDGVDRYTVAWRVIKKFHAEDQAEQAMEYWNNLGRTEGAVMVATPEASALANTLDRK